MTRSLALALAVSLAGCAVLRPPRTPMHSVRHPPRGTGDGAVLVLLPGFGDRDTTFGERGFVDAVHAAAPGLTIVAADAYFGYYRKRTVLTRLEEDVLVPLRKEGFRRIYLAGTSMGGHGAVAFARSHPEGIAGVLLFAPYLGPRAVVDEVSQAGGLCKYTPPEPFTDDSEGFARANYAWLARQICAGGGVPVYTAVGADDRLAVPVGVVSEPLPAERKLVLPGGHGWAVWTPAARELAGRAFGTAP